MRERLKALRHLLGVYETIEKMHQSEAQRAAGEVHEATGAIGMQYAIVREASSDERQALTAGDRMGWSSAAMRQEIAGTRRLSLERVLREREERSRTARRSHIDSRQSSERMKHLVDSVEACVMELEERRAQTVADDRYLSRRRWKQRERSEDAPQI